VITETSIDAFNSPDVTKGFYWLLSKDELQQLKEDKVIPYARINNGGYAQQNLWSSKPPVSD
jgi:hypothetical protein